MDPEYWKKRWRQNEIGFHMGKPNPLLLKYFSYLELPAASRIFLPLCGKSLDIHWLLRNGFQVIGCELCTLAVEQLFDELKEKPTKQSIGEHRLYSSPNLDIYNGDLFQLQANQVGKIDAIYDRAALVALPEKQRLVYSEQIISLSKAAPQLLLCFRYDQTQMDGPPFSLTEDHIKKHYQHQYHIQLLYSEPVKGGIKGLYTANEDIWLLTALENCR
jgi:thiopurine S-methyltransferase